MKRGEPPKRRTPLPRPSKNLKRSRIKQRAGRAKPRPEGHEEPEYLEWLRSQDCRVAIALNSFDTCTGPMQAHHAGEHGLGMKCPDAESYSLCLGCHDNRHRGIGFFKGMPKANRREWEDEQVAISRALFARDLTVKGRSRPGEERPE